MVESQTQVIEAPDEAPNTGPWIPAWGYLLLACVFGGVPGLGLYLLHHIAFGRVGSTLLIVAFVLTGIGAAVSLSFAIIGLAIKSRPSVRANISGLTLFFALGSMQIAGYVKGTDICEQTHFAAVPIISALEQYFGDVGIYPKTLEELAPGYLDLVPFPAVWLSGKFRYRSSSEGKEYVLGFLATRNRSYVYHPEEKGWRFKLRK